MTGVGVDHRQDRLAQFVDAMDEISTALLSGRGLVGAVEILNQRTGAPAAVVEAQGRILAAAPSPDGWLHGRAVRAIFRRTVPIASRFTVVGIDLAETEVALLSTRTDDVVAELLRHVAGLVGLELSKQSAVDAGRRELTGQVLEDVVHSMVPTPEAVRRLPVVGIDPDGPHTVLLALVHSRPELVRAVTWRVSPLRDSAVGPMVTGRVGPYVAVVLRGHQSAGAVARMLSRDSDDEDTDPVPVGIGGPYGGVDGLRWAFLEAQEAVARGPGVNDRHVINIPRLLLSNPDLPLRELGREVLRPLARFDATHDGELIGTLRLFLESNGSAQKTARALFVHRNTVRYRLEQIERLLGVSLTAAETRVHLWLALLATADGDRARVDPAAGADSRARGGPRLDH